MAARVEVAPRQNVFRPQYLSQLIAANLGNSLVNIQNNVLIVTLLGFVVSQQGNTWNVCQLLLVLLVISIINSDKLFQSLQRDPINVRR